jgi:hypothetical protein
MEILHSPVKVDDFLHIVPFGPGEKGLPLPEEPNRRVHLLPNTLLTIHDLPRVFSEFYEVKGSTWVYARYFLLSHDGQAIERFQIKTFSVSLSDMPALPLQVRHLPIPSRGIINRYDWKIRFAGKWKTAGGKDFKIPAYQRIM